MLGEGSKIFLEEQFMNYLEKTLMTRPTEAGLGGIPSLQNKIRGYLNVKYLKNGNWSNPTLEVCSSFLLYLVFEKLADKSYGS